MEDEGRKAPNEDLDDNLNPASAGIIAQRKGKRPCVGNPRSAAGTKAPNEDLDDNSNPASAANITGKLIQLKGKRFFVRDSSSGAGTKALNGDHDDNPNHAIAGKIVQLEGKRFFVQNPRSAVDITGMKRLPYWSLPASREEGRWHFIGTLSRKTLQDDTWYPYPFRTETRNI